MNLKLLTEHHLEFLCLKGGCTGLSESANVKMSHCRKSHVMAHMSFKGDYSVVEKTCGQNQAYCIERAAEFSWRHIGADSCSSTIANSSL